MDCSIWSIQMGMFLKLYEGVERIVQREFSNYLRYH